MTAHEKRTYEIFYKLITNAHDAKELHEIPICIQLVLYSISFREIQRTIAKNIVCSHAQIARRLGVSRSLVRQLRVEFRKIDNLKKSDD